MRLTKINIALALFVALFSSGCIVNPFGSESKTDLGWDGPKCTLGPSGLIGWWDGDQTSGSTISDRVNGNAGNASNVSPVLGHDGNALSFSSWGSSVVAPNSSALSPQYVTVSAWVKPSSSKTTSAMNQVVVAKGAPNSSMGAGSFTSYDASNTDGAAGDKGFQGAIFDGRYVYFVPNNNGAIDGKVLRYDTTGDFSTASSWASYDASNADGVNGMKGLIGGAFDGRYVYFSPSNNGAVFGKVLRYDTTASFSAAGSWSVYDFSNLDGLNDLKGFRGTVFDGRYLYFIPFSNGANFGIFVQYDTTASFTSSSSWTYYDASNTDGSGLDKGYIGGTFDGRYIYFAPFNNGAVHGRVLRYDTSGTFGSASSWSAYNAINTDGTNGNAGFIGAIYDGRYVYFIPSQNAGGVDGEVLRYDTQGSFTASGSWASYDAVNTDGANGMKGFQGASFDGHYIYFTPNNNGAVTGKVLRYDVTGGFTTASSWSSFDASNTNGGNTNKSYRTGIFDGRYIYFAPFNNGAAHGNMLRYDTTGSSTPYKLEAGHSMHFGITSQILGPAFSVNTGVGFFSAMSPTPISVNQWHHLVGVYDGSNVSLYVDGVLAARTAASGYLVADSNNLAIGTLDGNALASFNGVIDEVQIYGVGLTASQVQSVYLATRLCR